MFGTVFQNDIIFADTLEENIAFGRNLNRTQIEKAANQACAKDFIEQKKGRYDFEAAIKGANLSGGQKQRILIARALANQPKILILDDSSSALDYKTDSKLRQAIREDFKETTLITIAQRISSVMHMNQILVLEEGEIIGYGTHEQLLADCEVYREIYESQMGGGRA
jgi:ATP-binding cassette subfamily B protein